MVNIARVLTFIFAVYVSLSSYLFADERGFKESSKNKPTSIITESRIALVIGNSDYSSSPLKNPINDARAIARILQELGFKVIRGENLSQKEIGYKILEFGEKLQRKGGGIGLFYFSGHGVQVNGRNYLIPIGTNITHEKQVEFEGVEVGRVLAEMENARNRMNIVILDACRDNPFARSFRSSAQGLASIDAPTGTLLAYATAPGKTAADGEGNNGLYTGELIKRMREPGLKIEDVFKRVRASVRGKSNGQQTPWESSSLEGDFYFNPSGFSPQIEAPEVASIPVPKVPTENASGQENADTYFSKGLAYIDKKMWDEAIVEFNREIQIEPNKASAYDNRGEAYYGKGQYDQAISDFNKAIEKDPGFAEAYYNRGSAYHKRGQLDWAMTDYNKAIELDPNFAPPYNNRGTIYHERGQLDRAILNYNKAIELDPNDARVYNNRGNVYYKIRQYDRAISDYNKALELDPNYAPAYENLRDAIRKNK